MIDRMNGNPDLSPEAGRPSSPSESLQGDTKQCPSCGNEIKAKARICRFCGARFEIATKGYCPHCHRMVEVGDENRCSECSGEVIDPHVVSSFIPVLSQPGSQAAVPASMPQPAAAPLPALSEAKTRPGCVTIYAILLFLGAASFLCGGIFGSTSPLTESVGQFKLAAGISMALAGVFMLILGIGLWQLKNWARIAMIVMQSLAIVGSIFSALTALTAPSTSLNQPSNPFVTILGMIL